ncbi:MAG: glutamine synthetase, partial [candidate division KSB1 bacterium]|nr:glutamine synthetase [candidate division KSB1 bacterium]
SQLAYHFMAGIIKHIRAMCAVLCPTVNSYKRLVSGYEAPVYVTWARINRSALIRVPKWFHDRKQSARIELRCPDPSCNPYLALAFMLQAGMDGIRNKLQPPEPVEENVYLFDEQGLKAKNIGLLPSSLYEALQELQKDELSLKVLGQHLFDRYLDIKSREWEEFRVQVTPWEVEKYLQLF